MAGCLPLTLAEVEHVSRTFAGDFQGQRNKALFIVGVKTGFRISALLSLKVSDVYQRGQVVDEVTVAKRNRKQQIASHTLPLHQEAKQALGHCLTCYRQVNNCYLVTCPSFLHAKGIIEPSPVYAPFKRSCTPFALVV